MDGWGGMALPLTPSLRHNVLLIFLSGKFSRK
jgi:hypothetical protein